MFTFHSLDSIVKMLGKTKKRTRTEQNKNLLSSLLSASHNKYSSIGQMNSNHRPNVLFFILNLLAIPVDIEKLVTKE